MGWFIACFVSETPTTDPGLHVSRLWLRSGHCLRDSVFGALWVRYRSGSGGARTLYTTSHVVYNVTDGHRSGVFLLFGCLTTWSDWFGASSCNNMRILKGSVGICRVSEPTSASQWQSTETSLLENTWNPTYMILTADLPKVQGFTCFFFGHHPDASLAVIVGQTFAWMTRCYDFSKERMSKQRPSWKTQVLQKARFASFSA